jgi:hypothetical protein
MQRAQLEHIIRASSAITGADQIVVIGSQAILGQFPQAPQELLISMEADVFTLRNPADADLIEGSIGEGSPFHQTFGYYAHGISKETALLPHGWQERLIAVRNENTGGGSGMCLEVHDLAAAKLLAGRDKDLDFLRSLFLHRLASPEVIEQRLVTTALPGDRRTACLARLSRLASEAGK